MLPYSQNSPPVFYVRHCNNEVLVKLENILCTDI